MYLQLGGFPSMPFGGRQGPPNGMGVGMGRGMPFGGGGPPGAFGQPQQHPLNNMLRPQCPNFFARRARRMSMPGGMPRPQQNFFAGRPWMAEAGDRIRNFDPSRVARSPGHGLQPPPPGRNFDPRRAAQSPGKDLTPRQLNPFPGRPVPQQTPRAHFTPEAPPRGEPNGRHQALQRYEKLKGLKTGGMSVAINLLRGRSDGKLYIEKRISIEGMSGKRAIAELNALKVVKGHPNLNQIIEHKLLDGRFCSMILEYCDRGSLQDRMQAVIEAGSMFRESDVWSVLLGISRALAFLHTGTKAGRTDPVPGWKAIAHLDIKPGNILICTSGGDFGGRRIVLADFGCAVSIEDLQFGRETGRRQPCGTPQWYPPEGLLGNGYGSKTDLYMLGATVHTLCHLRPVPSSTLPNYGSPCGNRYSQELNHVVKLLTQVNWRERPAARKVAPVALDRLRKCLHAQR